MEQLSENKLKWEKVEPSLGYWAAKLKPIFDDGTLGHIHQTLKDLSTEGRKIAPLSRDVYRVFRILPPEKVKCVILGLSPYHTIVNDKGVDKMVADGIPMSCGNHSEYKAPTLVNLYKAWEKEFEPGVKIKCERPQSLEYLVEQGVLLLNAAFTTEIGKPKNHLSLWQPFTRYLFDMVIGIMGVPVVFLGEEAKRFGRYLAPFQWTFELSHPASVSYRGSDEWDSENVFTRLNKVLYDMNKETICWLIPG